MTAHRPCRRSVLLTPTLALILAASALAAPGGLDATSWSAKVDRPKQTMPKPTSTDLSIPFPGNFGGGGEVLFPSTPSPFVVIGKNFFDKDVRQVWNLATGAQVGTFKGQLGLDDKTMALSPDGAYLAAKASSRKVIEVRATKDGRIERSFDFESPFLDFVDFAAGNRVAFGWLRDRKLEVADIKTGDKVTDLTLEKEADREAIAFSPGRAYLAASANDGTLRVYDLATGKVAGQAPTPRFKNGNGKCFGLAFSPDGAELAGAFEHFGEVRIAVWDAATGKQAADLDVGKDVARPAFYSGRGIEWVPDKSGWLVMGSAIVDRQSGKKVWTLPFDNQNFKVSPRRFLDDGHAMVVSSSPAPTLKAIAIPRDKIAGAARIVRSGGNAADAALPPLKAADLTGAKSVALPARAVAWSVVPGSPANPRRLSSRPITLKGKVEDFRSLLFPGPDSSHVMVVGTPKQLGQPDPYEGQARWVERFDLAGARELGRVELPGVSDPIAVAPDAATILLRESKAHDRLDLVDAADGKHVVGWRPYEKEKGDARAVAWAAFLDPGKVLTLNTAGMLILWSVPGCKALYTLDDAFHGAPVLDPGRALLAGFDGKTLRVLDAPSGALKGEGSVPATNLGVRPELKASAIDADGRRFAALFQAGTLACWDLKTGKVTSEFRPPSASGTVEWVGDRHVLLDNRTLVDLEAKRTVWEYANAPVAASGPDGRHWYVARGPLGKDESTLAAIDPLGGALEKAEALAADPKAPAVIRPGSRVSLKIEMAGPPGDRDKFLKELTDSLVARLKANGLAVGEDGPPTNRPGAFSVSYRPASSRAIGPDARLVVSAREKDTGRTIQYRRIGRLPNDIQVVRLVDLVCEMSLVDAKGAVSWMPAQVVPMQPFGFVLRMPAGENDPEVYLKKLQWARVKEWATTVGPPYFVARDGGGVVRLPGRTDLADPTAR